MTYLDRYRSMSDDELAEWGEQLFQRSLEERDGATIRLIELRNIVPFLVARLRRRVKDDQDRADIPMIAVADLPKLVRKEER